MDSKDPPVVTPAGLIYLDYRNHSGVARRTMCAKPKNGTKKGIIMMQFASRITRQ